MSDNINNFNAMETAFRDKKASEKQQNMDDLSAYDDMKKPEPKFVPPDDIPVNVGMGDEAPKQKPVISENVAKQQANPQQQFKMEYDDYEEDDNGFVDPQRPNPINEFDQQLFPGGPMISEVESWKKQHGDIWVVDDLPDNKIPVYIYRNITRYEYKAIMATPNTDPLMREEMICEQCVLFPYEYGYGVMSNNNAGVPTILAQHIMETSGFTKASMPRRL